MRPRKFARYALAILSIMSLLLCVTACVLWARSHRVQERVTWKRAGHRYTFHLFWARGSIACTTTLPTGAPGKWNPSPAERGDYPGFDYAANAKPIDLYAYWTGNSSARSSTGHGLAGFAYVAPSGSSGPGMLAPIGFLAACFAVAPTLWTILAVKRRRRKSQGRCLRCGYDLRASPDRCPECGTAVVPK